MTDFSPITNETLRAELEEFVTKPNELARYLDIFSNAHPRMQAISASVIEGEHHLTDKLTTEALAAGHAALEIMDDGLIAGMGVVGIKFRDNAIFVPEVLSCARAMKTGANMKAAESYCSSCIGAAGATVFEFPRRK